eukprot:GHVR01008915.1.p1 GENE.GHVR01008915.1~~GHVR01008915.1.p1  ORF type:complete len:196 (-),score=9.19 GHVR01008915.1:160-747(-)
MEFLVAQESSIGNGLQTALHLATSASVACEKMLRDDVPPDVHSLIRGQSVLIESLIADLLPAHANLTLRQRDIHLHGCDLPVPEYEALRRLPLFGKELFPTDLDALDVRVSTSRLVSDQQVVFASLAHKNTTSSAPVSASASKPGSKAKRSRRKTPQTQASQKGGSGRGQSYSKSKPAAKKGQNFCPGDKPETKK